MKRPLLYWQKIYLAALALFLGGAYRRAARRCPGFDGAVRECLEELDALEGEKCPSMDRTADTFARLLQSAAPARGLRRPAVRHTASASARKAQKPRD